MAPKLDDFKSGDIFFFGEQQHCHRSCAALHVHRPELQMCCAALPVEGCNKVYAFYLADSMARGTSQTSLTAKTSASLVSDRHCS
jgi:hypothetical protein